MDAGELRGLGLFDGTDDARLRELFALGTEVAFGPGEEVFVEGRPADFWYVLLEGRVDLVRHVGREERQLAVMEVPGQWAGGFRAWDEHGADPTQDHLLDLGQALLFRQPAVLAWAGSGTAPPTTGTSRCPR